MLFSWTSYDSEMHKNVLIWTSSCLQELIAVKIDGCLNKTEKLTALSYIAGLIHWILHFCVLDVWTERWNLAYLTWRAALKYSKYTHAQWIASGMFVSNYWHDSAPTPLVSIDLHSKWFMFYLIDCFRHHLGSSLRTNLASQSYFCLLFQGLI